MRAGYTHYCPSAGMPELREAAAAYLSDGRGIDVPPGRVLIANGAKPFLFFTILAVCDPGDEVIYPDPGFPIYESAISWAGAVPVPLPLHEEKDFVFDVGELEARLSPRTKLVILNSPQNPTGGVIDPTTIERDRHVAPGVRYLGALGRGLLAARLRRRVHEHRLPAGHARTHDSARRPLEGLRHDRLALRIRRRPRTPDRPARPLLRQLDLLRTAVRATGRSRRPDRAARRRWKQWSTSSAAAGASSSTG